MKFVFWGKSDIAHGLQEITFKLLYIDVYLMFTLRQFVYSDEEWELYSKISAQDKLHSGVQILCGAHNLT